MGATRYARAGVTVALLAALILVACYGISIALGPRPEGRLAGRFGSPRPPAGVPEPSPSPPATARPKARPAIVTTAGIPLPGQGVLIADLAVAGGRVLAVGPGGRLGTAPVGADEARRFSLVPLRRGSDRFMIHTATVAANGEFDCLAHTAQSLVTTSCDAGSPMQIFEVFRAGVDTAGRHLFTVRSGGRAVTLDRSGNVRIGLGAGTPFCFVPWNTAEDPFD
jgi:hypothetical protein